MKKRHKFSPQWNSHCLCQRLFFLRSHSISILFSTTHKTGKQASCRGKKVVIKPKNFGGGKNDETEAAMRAADNQNQEPRQSAFVENQKKKLCEIGPLTLIMLEFL